VAPPGPIPNPEVKRCSANGSVVKGYVRVGRRQVISKSRSSHGPAFCVLEFGGVLKIGESDLESLVRSNSKLPGKA